MANSAGAIHVLHVDDEPDFAGLAAKFLEREDDALSVHTVRTPEDGLELLDEREIDCIVSDYDMPGQDGIAFLETVRAAQPELPFILYTGKGSEEVASEAISAGVTDYLQKEGGTDQYAILANRIKNAVERHRIERQAEQTRLQLQAISEHSADAILIMDADSRIRFANRAVEDHFGYEPAELIDEPLTELMPERHRERHLAAVDRYLETDERSVNWSEIEFDALHADGTEVPVSISFGEFEQNGDRRFIGIIRDISDRTRLEMELREREEQFRQLAENIQEVVWMSDPEKQEMLYVNPAYEAIWGRSVESLYADPTSFLDAVHEDDRDRVEAAIADQASGTYEEEYRIVRTDGEVRWVWDRAIPLEDNTGEVYRIVGVAADITDRKVREREHQTTIDFLQELYETATATDLSSQEKITRLLTAGPELLGLPPGYLTRITRAVAGEADGTQRIIEASGDHELLQPGNTCPLSQSYCRNTIDRDGVLEVPDAEAAGWAGDPAYELFNLGCYIGTDITVHGELYGTVFFAEEASREEPFTDAERTFVRLLSQLVRYELEANDARQVLES